MIHRGGKKGILSGILLILGVTAILSLLPSWIWLVMIGTALIVLAVMIFRSC